MNTKDLVLLVHAAQQGDREAMTVLYERTSPQIWRTVRSMIRDEELAKDVQQETYLKAFLELRSLREPEKLLPWLRAIATNQAKSALEQHATLRFTELAEAERPEELPTEQSDTLPEQALESKEQAALVRRVLSVLPDGQRLIVGMYYYEQLSTREIAEKLGVSVSTVKSQLHFGRKTIRQRLAQLRKDGVQLFGFDFFPLFLRAWRKKAASAALRPILRSVSKPAAELVSTTGKGLLASKIAAVAASACVLGGAVCGTALLAQHRDDLLREGRPPAHVEEIREPLPTEDAAFEETEVHLPEGTEAPDELLPPRETEVPEVPEETEDLEAPAETEAPVSAQASVSVQAQAASEDAAPVEAVPVSAASEADAAPESGFGSAFSIVQKDSASDAGTGSNASGFHPDLSSLTDGAGSYIDLDSPGTDTAEP